MLYPTFIKTNRKFNQKKDWEPEFYDLVQKINLAYNKEILYLDKIDSPKSINLSILDTNKLKSDIRYINKNHDMLMRFSPPSFNQKYNKATIIIGVSRGFLSGSASLVFLEKKGGIWKIVYSNEFEIS
ncbi:hypothetical protein [Aquimarina sediminis]|uniref:hypothetical protein n=1 Tax=Aquimarina sediminis TaxID=2070536 RepID=UPI000FFE7362|nr:hypothetical protein [Aquimarina sediminis]